MFAYCNNNPVAFEDISGMASKSCLYDSTEPRMPWRDSGSGGGRPYKDYSLGSNSYGKVADKFYAVKFIKAVGDGLKSGAASAWNAYKYSINLQMEMQYQQGVAVKEFVEERFSTPEKTANSLAAIASALEGAALATKPYPVASSTFAVVAWIVGGIAIVISIIAEE